MINKVILVGNVGKDPEIKALQDGTTVANFSVATSEKRKEKKYTEWHNCCAFGKVAEIVKDWVRKGSLVYVEGSSRTSEYTDKEGIKRKSVQVIVGQLRNMSFKKEETHSDAYETPPSDEDVPF